MLKTFATVVLTLCAVMLADMGQNWMEIGHGLNPMLAFPLATVAFLGAFGVGRIK